jgi:hypothetical protein
MSFSIIKSEEKKNRSFLYLDESMIGTKIVEEMEPLGIPITPPNLFTTLDFRNTYSYTQIYLVYRTMQYHWLE